MNNTTTKQTQVPICAFCEAEFPTVRVAVEKAKAEYGMTGLIVFSHSYCLRHYAGLLKKNGFTDDQIKVKLQKYENLSLIPDLQKRTDLVNLWSQGIFTQEQLNQANKTQQQANQKITERFKTLAGINA